MLFFKKISPIGFFFLTSVAGIIIVTLIYFTAFFYGEISFNLFISALFSEFLFFIFDLLFIYTYVLYVTTSLTSSASVTETHFMIAEQIGKIIPSWLKRFIVSKLFPFYQLRISGYVSFLIDLKNSILFKLRIPASLMFICFFIFFFNIPLLLFFYNLDTTLEFGDFFYVLSYVLVGNFFLILYFYYKRRF